MDLLEVYRGLHVALRILIIGLVAVIASLGVQYVRRGTRRLIGGRAPAESQWQEFAQKYPKIATVTSLVASALTFGIFFAGLGFILSELNISLTAYLATASVVGLAVGFGSQGLVQDIVIGLTLVFSDAMDIGDLVEISGQVGRVEQIGLRFTVLSNLTGQRVFIPNRNITLVGRYPKKALRAFVDVQMPPGADEQALTDRVTAIAQAFRKQLPAIVLSDPAILGVRETAPHGWRYVRVMLRIWPGQQALIESAFRQRVIAALKTERPEVQDWMVTVSYGADRVVSS